MFVRLIVICVCLQSGLLIVAGQEPRLLDAFSKRTTPCGDFMGRMDSLLAEWMGNRSDRIAVIYYGHRYRKNIRHGKERNEEATVLSRPHRYDGRNYARSVPLYLLSRFRSAWSEPSSEAESLERSIVLLDGGYRENIEIEIWLIPRNGEMPKPTPTIPEGDIKFRRDKPYPTINYFHCYDGID